MDNLRLTQIYTQGGNYNQSFVSGMEIELTPTNPLASLGAKEVVLNSSNGTLASLHAPLSLSTMLNDEAHSYAVIA